MYYKYSHFKEKERCKQTKFLPIYNSSTLYAMNINSKASTTLSIYNISIHRTKGMDMTTYRGSSINTTKHIQITVMFSRSE